MIREFSTGGIVFKKNLNKIQWLVHHIEDACWG